jgi:hypothetical protein
MEITIKLLLPEGDDWGMSANRVRESKIESITNYLDDPEDSQFIDDVIRTIRAYKHMLNIEVDREV